MAKPLQEESVDQQDATNPALDNRLLHAAADGQIIPKLDNFPRGDKRDTASLEPFAPP